MAQFLRPSANITQTEIVGSYTAIDEVSFSDADYLTSNDGTDAVYECRVTLGGVLDPLIATGHIVRVRWGKADTNVAPDATGNTQAGTAYLYQGATLIATLGTNSDLGNFTTLSYTLTSGEANSITDYTDLRIRIDFPNSGGGNPNNRRGGAVSWAEMEVPDAPINVSPTVALQTTTFSILAHSVSVGTGVFPIATLQNSAFSILAYSVSVVTPVHAIIKIPVIKNLVFSEAGFFGAFPIGNLYPNPNKKIKQITFYLTQVSGAPIFDYHAKIYSVSSGLPDTVLETSSNSVPVSNALTPTTQNPYEVVLNFAGNLYNQDVAIVLEGTNITLWNGSNQFRLSSKSIADDVDQVFFQGFWQKSTTFVTTSLLLSTIDEISVSILPYTTSLGTGVIIYIGVVHNSLDIVFGFLNIPHPNDVTGVAITNRNSRITDVDFKFQKTGSPIADIVAEIWSVDGSNNPDTLLETSINTIPISSMPTGLNIERFQFQGNLYNQAVAVFWRYINVVTINSTNGTPIFYNDVNEVDYDAVLSSGGSAISTYDDKIAPAKIYNHIRLNLSILPYTVSTPTGTNITVVVGLKTATFSVLAYSVDTTENISINGSLQSASFSVLGYVVLAKINVDITANLQTSNFTINSYVIYVELGVDVISNLQISNFSLLAYSVDTTLNVDTVANLQSATFSVNGYTVTTSGNVTVVRGLKILNFSIEPYTILGVIKVDVPVNLQTSNFSVNAYIVSTSTNLSVVANLQSATFSVLAHSVLTSENISVSVALQTSSFSVLAYTVGSSVSITTVQNLQLSSFSVISPTIATTQNVSTTSVLQEISFILLEYSVSVTRSANVIVGLKTAHFSFQSYSVITDSAVVISLNHITSVFSVNTYTVSADRNNIVVTGLKTANFTINAYSVSVSGSINVSVNLVNAVFSVVSPTVSTTINVVVVASLQESIFSVNPFVVSLGSGVSIAQGLLTSTFSINSATIVTTESVSVLANVISATFTTNTYSVSVAGNINISKGLISLEFSVNNYIVSVERNTSIALGILTPAVSVLSYQVFIENDIIVSQPLLGLSVSVNSVTTYTDSNTYINIDNIQSNFSLLEYSVLIEQDVLNELNQILLELSILPYYVSLIRNVCPTNFVKYIPTKTYKIDYLRNDIYDLKYVKTKKQTILALKPGVNEIEYIKPKTITIKIKKGCNS